MAKLLPCSACVWGGVMASVCRGPSWIQCSIPANVVRRQSSGARKSATLRLHNHGLVTRQLYNQDPACRERSLRPPSLPLRLYRRGKSLTLSRERAPTEELECRQRRTSSALGSTLRMEASRLGHAGLERYSQLIEDMAIERTQNQMSGPGGRGAFGIPAYSTRCATNFPSSFRSRCCANVWRRPRWNAGPGTKHSARRQHAIMPDSN